MDVLSVTRLNRGCTPSRALIAAANVAYDAPTGSETGIAAEIDVDSHRMADNGRTFGRDTLSPDAVGSNS